MQKYRHVQQHVININCWCHIFPRKCSIYHHEHVGLRVKCEVLREVLNYSQLVHTDNTKIGHLPHRNVVVHSNITMKWNYKKNICRPTCFACRRFCEGETCLSHINRRQSGHQDHGQTHSRGKVCNHEVIITLDTLSVRHYWT